MHADLRSFAGLTSGSLPNREATSHCETIAAVLLKVSVLDATNGMDMGNLYCTATLTRLPGLSQDAEGLHVAPVGYADRVVVTVMYAELIPGKLRFFT